MNNAKKILITLIILFSASISVQTYANAVKVSPVFVGYTLSDVKPYYERVKAEECPDTK